MDVSQDGGEFHRQSIPLRRTLISNAHENAMTTNILELKTVRDSGCLLPSTAPITKSILRNNMPVC